MKLKYYLFIMTYLTPLSSFAFFCPNNFNQIDYGLSPEQVMQQCGKPNKEEMRELKAEGPQEWSYYIPQTVATGGLTQMQGTLKTQMTFDENGKAINISVNGIGVGSTTICGTNIQLGDTRDTIRSACGKPSFINKQEGSSADVANPLPPPSKIIEFSYNTQTGKIVKLTFQDGKLKAVEQ